MVLKSVVFWATVCKTVRPRLSIVVYLSCPILSCLSVCDVGVLWPNGWTDHDQTWHACRARPWPYCVRWGPSSPSPKGHIPPISGQYLLRPNGCMDQDATRHGARPRPRRLVLDGDPATPRQKGTAPSPQFSAHVYYSYCDFVRTLHKLYWFVQVQVQVLVFYAFYFRKSFIVLTSHYSVCSAMHSCTTKRR